MARENKAQAGRNRDVAFTPNVEDGPGTIDTPAYVSRPARMVYLHWLTVFCLVVAVTFILVRDQMDGRVVRQWLLEGHRHFGLFVLLLFFVRVAIRIQLGKLPPTNRAPKMVRVLAGLTHIAIYATLLAQPLLGWALSDAEGKPVHFLGLTLPAIVNSDEDLADTLTTWHLNIAWLLLGLVSLHIAGALWHHFIFRDQTLRAMLPGRRRA